VAASLVTVVVLAPTRVCAADDAVTVEMMVSYVSDDDGGIDPRGRKIHDKLRSEGFGFKSLEVLSSQRVRLAVDEVATIALPDGRKARVRPLSLSDGLLLAVDIEGGVQVDARARSGHLLVFSAGRYREGRLVVSVEATF